MPETAADYHVEADLDTDANLDRIERTDEGRLPHRRTELLEQALDPDGPILSARSGGYHGTATFVLEHDDLLWIVKDSHGSCSHCDWFESAKRTDGRHYRVDDSATAPCEQVRAYADRMLRQAYAFASVDDAVRFLEIKSADQDDLEPWGWPTVVDETLDRLTELGYDVDADVGEDAEESEG